MSSKKRMCEDNSVLALLYDEYKRIYPETIESIQSEIEALHEELYGAHLLNAEEVTAIVVAMGEDRCRCAHEAGVKTGVRLALDLELDGMMMGVVLVYVIAKMKGGFQAILIHRNDNWYIHKLKVGRNERRIILQVRGRKYVAYTTNSIRAKYPNVRTEQLDALCDEIMGELQCRILRAEDYVDVPKIAEIVELKNAKHWMEAGVLPVTSLEAYYGRPLDPAAEQLVTQVRVDISDIIIMDHEPPVDCIQEKLPY